MLRNENVKLGRIKFRLTAKTDLDYVMKIERAAENAAFIRQWSIHQHKSAISDENMAHLVVENTSDHKILGYVILVGLENPDQSIELKRIVIQERNKGFGKEALQLVKKIVFVDLGMHRLWLEVMEHNGRAIRLYESEGFTSEGVHRESMKQGKHFLSLKVMSILAHEYDRKESNETVQDRF